MSQVETGIMKYRAVIASRKARKQELVDQQIARTKARLEREKKAKGKKAKGKTKGKHDKLLASHTRKKKAQSK